MKKFFNRNTAHRRLAFLTLTVFLFTIFLQPIFLRTSVQADTGGGTVSLTALGTSTTENFDSLANSGTANTALPTGWYITETGGGARDNEQYAADTGSSNTADTYSYGASGSTERALGGLRSGTLIPVFGARLTNNTGTTITSLNISYTGEEWRLGTAARTDRIDFQISVDATDLTTGTYTDVNALDFTTPNTATVGAKNGNDTANRTVVTAAISSLNIAPGATFFIRWTDLDASGADDGLAVDDFSITPNGTGGGGTPSLSINNATMAEGNAGTTNFPFTVSLSSAAAADVTFNIATADGTATVAGNDYAANSASVTIPAGTTSYTFNVAVNGDTATEPNETFFVNITNVSTNVNVTDAQGLGTINNDDVSITPINQIQGSGSLSPFAGQSVTTGGIVTAIVSNGFFIQTPDAGVDADQNTSEGIFVFTSTAPPASVALGNNVAVSGTLSEFSPSTDPNSPPLSEITFATVTLLTAGNPLPAPIVLTAAETTAASETTNPLDTLEEYEGMRVRIDSLRVVAPTGGNVTEASATAASNGVFQGVVTGVSRPIREIGLEISSPLPSGTTATNIPRFDENPERIRVDSDRQTGSSAINVTTDATVTNLVGVLDYGFRAYTILPDTATPPTVGGNLSAISVPAPQATEMTVASFNLERFFDTVNDGNGAPTLTATAFANRLNKASLAIRNVLQTPDVLGVIEVENLSTLQTLAAKINNDAVAAGGTNPNYQAYLSEGNDVGGIDVGFLVKSARVTVLEVTQFGKTDTISNPNGSTSILNDRPPLLLRATIQNTTNNAFSFTVIVNHLRSLNGIDDETAGTNGYPTGGARIRDKRRLQAEYLANLVQSRQTANSLERIFVIGDFNAFQFSDGYVDSIGTIKGTPTPADQVTLASPDLVNPDLINLADALPQPSLATAERYSYVFDGNAQILDHILVNQRAFARINGFHYARLDADFPETFRSDPNRPERISDHDAAVAYVSLALPTAANAELGGRITSGKKFGISNLNVNLTDQMSGAVRTVRTDVNGYYRFTSVPVGRSYVVVPYGKRYVFAPGSQLVTFNEVQENIDFEVQKP